MKQKILVLGAGRSSAVLIDELKKSTDVWGFDLIVADQNYDLVLQKVGANTQNVKSFEIQGFGDIEKLICENDIVFSLLPPTSHIDIAILCIKYKRHLITASYATDEILNLHTDAQKAGVKIVMECGLDPGLDHMSALQMIDKLQNEGGEILSFSSSCGGLMADETDHKNPWKYYITWNPKNVVLAGQGEPARFKMNGKIQEVHYNRLFSSVFPIKIGSTKYEMYPNRDSIKYQKLYGLDSADTFIRGTIRKQGFCSAWDALVKLGLTQTSANSQGKTYKEHFLNILNYKDEEAFFEMILSEYGKDILQKIKWLDLFNDKEVEQSAITPAELLQRVLEDKWKPSSEDKDLVVMKHEIVYKKDKILFKRDADLVILGEKSPFTAMAKTVGLPMFYAFKMVLQGQIQDFGIILPTKKHIYEYILAQLINNNIVFIDYEHTL